ncbi:ParA family protein [Methylobacterium sp. ARG-1]|uniref:ParA family protein n=1 Tax=Methylobacterium sp. ARG-1 TaxID=1692501 RepID=UPI0006800030|nr:ParA family protein [Methylobacterium sp. ARG-1]
MKILTIAARKGGSGKSTIAASMAAAAAQAGEGVVILDLDPQKSLAEWHERREVDGVRYQARDGASLAELMPKLKADKVNTLVLIDTQGDFNADVTAALRVSDLCLIPVRASVLDVTAVSRTVEGLRTLGRRYAFVLSQIMPSSPARAEEAAGACCKLWRRPQERLDPPHFQILLTA